MPSPRFSEITPPEYDRIIAVYRRHGGYQKAVADELGWTVSRAKRVYTNGYPKLGYEPIQKILGRDSAANWKVREYRQDLLEQVGEPEPVATEEEVEEKATVIQTREADRLRELMRIEEQRRKAREDAIQSRAEEAMLVSITRRNALALNGVTASLLKGAVALSQKIQVELEEEAATGELSTQEKIALVRSAAAIARFNSEATMMAVKSERLVVGEPIDAGGDVPESDGTLDEAAEWIERTVVAVKRARARGLLSTGDESDERH